MGAGIDPSLVERYYKLKTFQDLNLRFGIQSKVSTAFGKSDSVEVFFGVWCKNFLEITDSLTLNR